MDHKTMSPPPLARLEFFVSLVVPGSARISNYISKEGPDGWRAGSGGRGTWRGLVVSGSKEPIQMGIRGVLSCSSRIAQVAESETHPPAPWGSASLPPCLQGPIPGRLEGGGSYFLLHVGELRYRVWAGEAGLELQGMRAKTCAGEGRSYRLMWSRGISPSQQPKPHPQFPGDLQEKAHHNLAFTWLVSERSLQSPPPHPQ